MRSIDVCAGLYVIISLVTKSLYPLEGLCNSLIHSVPLKWSCPEKWCKQAFQVFKRSAVIS